MRGVEYVDPGQSDELMSALSDAGRVAVDTEFMREKTFYAQLCLVQIGTPAAIYCADPLTGSDLGDFWTALTGRAWVLHSGRQDIEVVYQTAGRMPESLFDTQVAAALLGYAPQIGYAALVSGLFGKDLPKTHTRADWTRRPLSEEMIVYAAEDVEYLLDACDLLTERLSKLGRLEWASEDSAYLLETALYEGLPADAVERVKGARNLRGRARRAAVGLATWRETRAARSNRPRQWILRDAVLLEIAVSNPTTVAALTALSGMPPTTAKRSAEELLEILQAAAHGSDDYVPPARPDEKQKLLLKAMQDMVGAEAASLGIAAEILAPRKELSAAMLGERSSRVFSGWRREIVGDRLLKLLG